MLVYAATNPFFFTDLKNYNTYSSMDCKCVTWLLVMCDVYVILSGQVSHFYVPERLFCFIIQFLLTVFLHVLSFLSSQLLHVFLLPFLPSLLSVVQ